MIAALSGVVFNNLIVTMALSGNGKGGALMPARVPAQKHPELS
jgi:hypothetical protein